MKSGPRKDRTPQRTPQQIVAAVKGAMATLTSSEVDAGAPWAPCTIRLSGKRFALVREILGVDGVLPGGTNIHFGAALAMAESLGVVTTEEKERFFRWSRAEEAANATKRELADLETRARRLGLKLVKNKRTIR